MKLFKKGGVYHARFQNEAGKTSTITTKCATLKDATEVVKRAKIKEIELASLAAGLTNEVVTRIVAGKKVTLRMAVDQYADHLKAMRRSPNTINNTMMSIDEWCKFSNLWDKQLSSITGKHVDKWINAHAEAGAGTRRVKLSHVRGLFRYCVANRMVLKDPTAMVSVDVRGLTHLQRESSKRKPFTARELEKIVQWCDRRITAISTSHRVNNPRLGTVPRVVQDNNEIDRLTFWRFAVQISSETGLRLGDVCQLEWDCFIPGEVVVWTDKRDKRIALPVSRKVEDLLADLPVNHRRFLFPEYREAILDTKRRTLGSVQFSRLCKQVKVGGNGKSFHSIRHYRVSEWKREGKTLEDIARDVGHSNTRTTEGYVHADSGGGS